MEENFSPSVSSQEAKIERFPFDNRSRGFARRSMSQDGGLLELK